MNRVYGYVRVSTDDQADSGLGLQAYRQAVLREFEAAWRPQGFSFAGTYEDAGQSGSLPLASRDAGSRLVAAVGTGDVILFPKLDRGFRNTEDTLTQVRVLGERGVRCRFLDLPFDTATPVGEALLTVVAGFSTMERRLIGERTKEALAVRKRRDTDLGRPSPLGRPRYGTRRRNGRLEVEPGQYADGLLIQAWAAKGFTDLEIAWHLNVNIERTGTKRRWDDESVRRARESMAVVQQWLKQTDKEGRPLLSMPKGRV